MAPTDFDGDGDIDVIAADASTLWLYERFDPTRFEVPVLLTDAAGPWVRAADLDGDDAPDVVTLRAQAIEWRSNLGHDAVSSAISIPSAGFVNTVEPVDLDADGDVDLLAGGASVSWFENLGGGAFAAEAVVDTGVLASDLSAADVDGDGDLDWVAAFSPFDTAGWYENLGGGAFGPLNLVTTTLDVSALDVGDIDADGDLDLVAITSLPDQLVVGFVNRGGGLFGPDQEIADCSFFRGVEVVDVDADGDADVLARCSLTILYESDGAGGFSISQTWDDADASAVVDDDGDGDPDLVLGFEDGTIAMEINSGGAPEFPTELDVTSPFPIAIGIDLVDLDGDGDLDVVRGGTTRVDSNEKDALQWHENIGGGAFSDPPHPVGGSNNDVDFRSVAVVDYDGDGRLDVVAAHTSGVQLLLDAGDLTFPFATNPGSTDGDPMTVDAADIDGDGDPDLVVTESFTDRVVWIENTGGAPVAPHVIGSTADGASSAIAFDADGDGDPDVAATSRFDHTVAWYENLGGGVFGPEQVLTTTASLAFDVASGDLDGDGDPDLVAVSLQDDEITWFENTGAGFGAGQILSRTTDRPRNVIATDLDDDGLVDVVVASDSGGAVAVYPGLGGGVFGPAEVLEATGSGILRAGDIDGDGDQDLLVGGPNAHWLENPRIETFDLSEVSPEVGVRHLVRFAGATPGGTVRLLGSANPAPSILGAGPCPGLALASTGPRALGSTVVHADGTGDLEVRIPAGASGHTLVFQAVDLATCTVSGVRTTSFP